MSKSTKSKTTSSPTALTTHEAKEWVRELNKANKANKASCSTGLTKSRVEEDSLDSNVVLAIGDGLDSTAIYVGGVKISGVVHATLDFNPDAGHPTLHLEIFNPKVKEA